MIYKTIYVVLYKEEITSQSETQMSNGICEWGYENENEAIAKVNELVMEKLEECNNNCLHDKNDNGDWQKIIINSKDDINSEYEYSVYEYSVQNVAVVVD